MDKDLRILQLEREASAIRSAAVTIIMGMADAIAPTAEGRVDLATGFEEAAAASDDPEMARLARLIAGALRRR